VSIRPGWFHHPAEDARVRSVEALVNLYFRSVGRNGKLLLNVPPTRDGVLHPTDVERLMAFADRRRAMFAEDLAAGAKRTVRERDSTFQTTLLLPREVSASIVRLEEDIEQGQRVSSFVISQHKGGEAPFERGLAQLARGSTIGYARLDRFVQQPMDTVFLETTGAEATVRLYA
jgi:alpha-L-fucosidase